MLADEIYKVQREMDAGFMSFANEDIWIIGASSGIGEALARELASQGARLILSARREDELNALNESLGGTHLVVPLDVSDEKQVSDAVGMLQEQQRIPHRVIFLAAIFRHSHIAKTDPDFAKSLVEVNLMGALYVTYATLPLFSESHPGQIVLCGSIAGYSGLPGGQPYCATKAAIISLAESLYAEAEAYVDVKVINPGFVRTRITDKNEFWMPAMIECDEGARAIAKGLWRKSFEIHFPKRLTYAAKLLGVLPYALKLRVLRSFRGKA